MIVIDASVLAPALADDDPEGRRARDRLRDEVLLAPALIDLEVASTWRRAVRAGMLPENRARQALDDLVALPIRRARHWPHLDRIWELRENLTPYDAAYVSLAEAFAIPLLTADEPLSRAPGLRCEVELLR